MKNFPLFSIKSNERVNEVDGLRIITTSTYRQSILDDTTLEGDFAARRLRMQSEVINGTYKGYRIYKVNEMIEDENQLFYAVYNLKRKYFVDGNGVKLKYEKQKHCKIVTHKVEFIYKKNGRTVVTLDNEYRFATKSDIDFTYVQLAHLGRGIYIIYGFCNEPMPTLRRKI